MLNSLFVLTDRHAPLGEAAEKGPTTLVNVHVHPQFLRIDLTHVCYMVYAICTMKKLFTERARIVVYLEKADLELMEKHIKTLYDVKQVSDWARVVLLEELDPNEREGRRNEYKRKDVPRTRKVRVVERSTPKPAGVSEVSDSVVDKRKTCSHGTPKGNNCWQCGGLAHVES